VIWDFWVPKFTWVGRRLDGEAIRERLDRAVANSQWCGLHHQAVVNVLASCTSDHNPLLLQLNNNAGVSGKIPKEFKVEASWMIDEDFNDIVRNAWEEGDTGQTAIQTARLKLANCQVGLKRWSGNKFGVAERKLKRKRQQLVDLQRVSCHGQ
jgi:hypothetical protein